MAKFTDSKGRDWLIRVDVAAIRHIRDLFEINLGDIGEAPKYLVRLADDVVLLCDLLFVLCEEQAKEKKISDEDFGRSLAGDAIDHATMALEEAITDFFPQRKRSLLQRLRKKIETVRTTGMELVGARLDDPNLDLELGQMMKAKMDEAIKHSLTQLRSASSLQESSAESTPTP
ncbi:hypothetical protein LCGC14_2058490 [marine sediment metagenome]|uniref:Uncharacterized protein n=1 Tax=marine sediment metagenome TaxID=412755 RepID=A0A0F9HIV1_9ZZZZ